MTWPILSVVTFLPTLGALLIWISRGDDEAAKRNARWIALWTTIIATVLVSLLSLLGFFLFARSLAGVIARLTETMSSLAGGDLDASIQGETRRDEVGAMARAVQVFKDNALRTKQLEHDAVQQRSHSEDERQKTAEQDRKRTEEMTQATNGHIFS